MKLTILAGEIGNRTSGQSRFAMNLTAGLKAAGVDVSLCASSLLPEAGAHLRGLGIPSESLGRRSDPVAQARLLTLRSNLGRSVAARAVDRLPSEWYVVLADTIVDAIEVLPAERSVYISNGDLALLFLSPTFYASQPFAKRWLARGMARYILQNGARARRYRRLFANSEFTRGLMSFLYATPFRGVVHPPVDPAAFSPEPSRAGPAYALALARNDNEQGLDLLREIAAQVPLTVVGGAEVAGARNLGPVSDLELRHLYASARLLAFPVASEMFGYAVAESMACGTPAVAFDSGGPADQIRDGVSGWLVRSPEEFVATSVRLVREGFPVGVREEARRSAERFSIPQVTQRFLEYLNEATVAPG